MDGCVGVTSSTQSLLNDLERAVDDSVACVRGLCRDPRFVPGGGATEMELAHQIFKHGESQARGLVGRRVLFDVVLVSLCCFFVGCFLVFCGLVLHHSSSSGEDRRPRT